MQIKLKTVVVVVLLSVLVWVFAERAVVKTAMVDVEIEVFSNNPEYIVQYLDKQGETIPESSQRVQINVKGPASLIQPLREGKLIPRVVRSDIETENYTNLSDQEFRDFTPRVLDVLDSKVMFEGMGAYLIAEDSKPAVLPIRVTKLIPVTLNIRVVDENGILLPPDRIESIEPKQIQAYVAGGMTNDAEVTLSSVQQAKAAQQAIAVPVRIPGLARAEQKQVAIKLMPETTTRPTSEITKPRVGICKSPGVEGKYRIIPEDLENRLELDYKTIKYTGPKSAQKIFEERKYHLILYITDEDISGMNGARKLEYNIPDGVQIINPSTTTVRFRLEKIQVGE